MSVGGGGREKQNKLQEMALLFRTLGNLSIFIDVASLFGP